VWFFNIATARFIVGWESMVDQRIS
jgi:hypothetical protein